MKLTGAFKVLLPLIAGILFADYYPINLSKWYLIVGFALLLIFILVRKNNFKISNNGFLFSLLIFFFLSGIYLKNAQNEFDEPNHFSKGINTYKETQFRIKLIDQPTKTNNWYRSVAEVISINNQKSIGKIMIYLEQDNLRKNQIQYGSLISCQGKIFEINSIKNPEEFNYKKFLARRKIYHHAFIKKDQWCFESNSSNHLLGWVYKVKEKCIQLINRSPLNTENKSIIKALVLGDKSEISEETMMRFSTTGTLHVLAVSGLHVGIVMMILNFILLPLKRLKKIKWLIPVLVVLGIWFFAALTGFSPSVSRAAVMFSFVTIGSQLERDVNIYQSLTVSALILILVNPNILFELGFLLSYAAVIGIVALYPIFYKMFYFKFKLADKIWQIAAVSIAAQIATLPLSIYYFNNFPIYFLFANIIAIPLSFALLALTISALATSFVPIVSYAIFYLINLFGNIFLMVIDFIETLPFASFGPFKINMLQVVLAYLFLFILFSQFKNYKLKLRLGLLLLITFLSISIFKKWIIHQENNLVIYRLNDANLIDFTFNGNLYAVGDSIGINHPEQFNFQIKNNRIASTVKVKPDKDFILQNESKFQFQNKTIRFITKYSPNSKNYLTDFIYFYNCGYYPIELLDKYIENHSTIILGSGCDKKFIRLIQRNIPPIQLINLNQTGAIILKFN